MDLQQIDGNIRKFFDRLTAHPLGVAIIAEHREEIRARRKELGARIEASKAEMSKRLPALLLEESKAKAAYDEAMAAVAVAFQRCARAKQATLAVRNSAAYATKVAEIELLETQPPAIQAFLNKIDEETAQLCRTGLDRIPVPGSDALYSGGVFRIALPVRTWIDSIATAKFAPDASSKLRWLEAAVGVRREAAELWREPNDEKVEARIAELQAELDATRTAAA
jgi:hypothetical protein